MTSIYFDDVPNNLTVINYIKSKLNWSEAVNAVGGVSYEIVNQPIKTINNSANILCDIYDVYTELGAVNWQSRDSCQLYGLSLTYNQNNPESNWKLGSFGHPRYQPLGKFEYYTAVEADQVNRVKGDYLDSLGFRTINDSVKKRQSLFELLNIFSCGVHRVTSRTINGNCVYPTMPGIGGMHRDESQFESLRLNVCISNNGCFGLQYIDMEPSYPSVGDINFINTDVMHRPFINSKCDFQRTHLIINISPWLNYHKDSDSWSPNEYFGKVHPVDMVKQGLIFKQGVA